MTAPAPRPDPLRQSLMLVALVAIAVLPFLPAVHGGFVWDDNTLLVANANLRSPDGWRSALSGQFFEASAGTPTDRPMNRQIFRPVVSLLYWVEFQLWGLNVVGYHVVNLALHAACVVLVWFWLRRRGLPEVAVFVGTAVFATHPSRAESVAWVSGCTDLWMTLWVLIGLTIWDRTRNVPGALVAGLAFTVAFFCKEIAIVVPLALAGEAFLSEKLRERLPRLIAVVGVAVVAVTARLAHLGITGNGGVLGGPVLTVVRVVATLGGYVRLALVPWPASTQVGYLLSANAGGAPTYPAISIALGIATIAGVFALLVLAHRRLEVRPWLSDAVWFFIPLLPALNLVPLTLVTYVNERHIYLAGLGLAALAGRATTSFSVRAMAPPAMLLVAGYAFGSSAHARHFRSNETLWTYEAEQNPQDFVALSNLLQVRVEQSRFADVQALAVQMMRVMPHAEDKASAFRFWLDGELARAVAMNDDEVLRVRKEFDAIASKGVPEDECGRLYETIEEPGRKWLRRSPPFRLRRAEAAAALGDFGSAARQLEALDHDAGPASGALRPLVAAWMASGDWDKARARLAAAPAGGESERLRILLEDSQARVLVAPSEVERTQSMAGALRAAGEPEMARAIERSRK